MSQVDPVGFGDRPEEMAIAVETPRASDFRRFPRLARGPGIGEQRWVSQPTLGFPAAAGFPSRVFVGQFDGGGTVPFNVDYANKGNNLLGNSWPALKNQGQPI